MYSEGESSRHVAVLYIPSYELWKDYRHNWLDKSIGARFLSQQICQCVTLMVPVRVLVD